MRPLSASASLGANVRRGFTRCVGSAGGRRRGGAAFVRAARAASHGGPPYGACGAARGCGSGAQSLLAKDRPCVCGGGAEWRAACVRQASKKPAAFVRAAPEPSASRRPPQSTWRTRAGSRLTGGAIWPPAQRLAGGWRVRGCRGAPPAADAQARTSHSVSTRALRRPGRQGQRRV